MRILLVDDEQGYLGVMKDVLSEAGHTVALATDGKAARELFDLEPFDIVISDVFMPTLDGVRFHSYVREFAEHSTVPFIFISGHEGGEIADVVTDPAKDFFFSKTTPVAAILKFIESMRASGTIPSR